MTSIIRPCAVWYRGGTEKSFSFESERQSQWESTTGARRNDTQIKRQIEPMSVAVAGTVITKIECILALWQKKDFGIFFLKCESNPPQCYQGGEKRFVMKWFGVTMVAFLWCWLLCYGILVGFWTVDEAPPQTSAHSVNGSSSDPLPESAPVWA